jgi:hypothetical protein
MASQVAREARQRVKNYKQALKYLDSCGEFTFEKYCKTNQIATLDMSDSKLRALWDQADFILPMDGMPGGKEAVRFLMRDSLIEGITTFESLSDKLGGSAKKWWQFWK